MSDPYAGIAAPEASDPYAGFAAPETAAPAKPGVDLTRAPPDAAMRELAKAKASLTAQIAKLPPAAQQVGWQHFNADPRIAALRQAASKPRYGFTELATSKLTMGLTDKIAPLVTAAFDAAHGHAFGDSYHQRQAEQDQARSDYQAQNPGTDWATLPLNFMGGGAGGAVKQTMGQIAKTGAGMGTLAGVGNSRGSVVQQAGQTALSALGGTILAPALATAIPAAAGAVGRGARKVASLVTRTPQAAAPPTRSGQILLKTLAAQGQTPQEASAMIREAHANNVPMALMDTGDEARGLASGLARKPGPTRKLIRDVVLPRQVGQAERVQGAVNRDLGPTVGVATEGQRLEAQAASRAKPLYERSYAHGEVTDPDIAALMQHPEMKGALSAGQKIHADDVFMAKVKGEAPPPPLPKSGLDVRSLDYTKRALDRKIDAAYSGDSAAKMQLPFLKDARATLLNKLDAAVPDYAAARAAYAGPQTQKEALEFGKSALTKSADDIVAMTSKMGDGERDAFKLGLRSAIYDSADSKGDYADNIHALLGTPKKRAALARVFGGEKQFGRFMETMKQEGQLAATHTRVNTGSTTAANLADDANFDGIGGALAKAAERSAQGQGITSNIVTTLASLHKHGTRKASERVIAELAAGLSESDPVALQTAFRAANRAAAAQRAGRHGTAALRKVGTLAGGRSAATISSLFAPSQ